MNIKNILILLVLATGLGFILPTVWQSISEPTPDLSQYCMLSDQVCQQGEVKIRLDHVYVHPLTATPVEVFWPNATTDELSMSLQGVEMNMGQVQVKLTMIKPDVFQGDILLPICSESQMTWYGSITDGQKTVQTALRMKER